MIAEMDAGSMSMDSRRDKICFAESPASIKTRVVPHSMMVEFPVEPEPRMENLKILNSKL